MANTGYKIDYTSNTIIMNYKFAEAAGKYGTPEYLLLKDIHNDYPDMKEIVRSGRAKKTARVNKRLTYKNMESYISSFENSAEILAEFNDVKMRSKKAASPYAYVLDWFKNAFPENEGEKEKSRATRVTTAAVSKFSVDQDKQKDTAA